MRKNFGAKPWVFPMPVFIVGTYDENGVPDAMNAAWGGISDDTRVVLCLSPEHKTVANLQKSGAFTLSMGDVAHMAECDYVGIVTANKEPDKVAKCGLHPVKSEFVNAPYFEELKMSLDCTVISYNPETCCLIGEIVNVNADESVLDEKGAIDQTKLEPISYDPVKHLYVRLGETVGRAFHDGRKFK
jgi:flavin reductase (DIM6/NTAB) family NADH-FMN oxidoreductase RutF